MKERLVGIFFHLLQNAELGAGQHTSKRPQQQLCFQSVGMERQLSGDSIRILLLSDQAGAVAGWDIGPLG